MTLTSKEKLEALRNSLRIKEEAKQPQNQNKTAKSDIVYRHWDIPDNTESTIRLLPDGNPNNPEFWVTKLTINLPFAGQVGGEYATDDDVSVTVPCVEMFGKTCPIIAATKPWWKDDSKKDLARQYYKKKSYIFQGFVVKSPFVENNAPENPIRRFVISQSIYEIIYKGIMNPEFDDFPVDYLGGRDFKIAKTKKGGADSYANYSTSSWSFRPRPLTENELVAIEQYGLPNLSDVLGQEPDSDGIEMIKQMFKDSVEGKPFDFDSYGLVYRAYGARENLISAPATQAHRVTDTVVNKPVETASTVSTSEETKNTGNTSQVADILAQIRARTAGNN